MEPMMFEGPRGAIAYRESQGTGRAVVLVHGNSSSMRAFERQMSAPLARALRLVVIDLPGHGRSADMQDAGYGLPAYADALVGFASDRGLQDAVFVGWSLGGHIILEAIPALPRARGFMIFGTPPLGFPPAMDQAFLPNPAMGVGFTAEITRAQAEQYVESFFRPDWSDIPASFVDDVMRTDGRARAQLAASIAPGGYRDEIEIVAHLDRPLAVLHGAREQLVNGAYLETLQLPTLWRRSVQVLPDAGHAPQWEDAAAFNALLGAFAADVG